MLVQSIYSEDEFEQIVLQKDKSLSEPKFILVDFWASWCQPCKFIAPILEEVAQEYDEKYKNSKHDNPLLIAKVDVETLPNIAARYRIRGVPTLILFENGRHCAEKVGALNKVALLEFLAPICPLDH